LKTIIVNDVAASSGGALSILRQFLAELKNNEVAKSYRWIVFVSNDLVNEYNDDHIEIVKVNAKKWRNRIWWETHGISRWLDKHHIRPDVAVSFMSVGFRMLNCSQIIYIHQPLPFGDFREFKIFEMKARFYTWGVGKWMKWSIKRDSTIVVQTNWMKEAVSSKLEIPHSQIHVIKPEMKPLSKPEIEHSDLTSYHLFYPAVPGVSYKNHELLIRMLSSVKKNKHDLYSKLRLSFTCKPDDNKLTKYYYRLSKKLAVDERIDWKGYLSKNEMVREYLESDIILFPSKLETFGLPLVEAASLGKPILVLDKPYAHDVLVEYEGAKFLADNPQTWMQETAEILLLGKLHFKPLVNDKFGAWSDFVKLCEDCTFGGK